MDGHVRRARLLGRIGELRARDSVHALAPSNRAGTGGKRGRGTEQVEFFPRVPYHAVEEF